MFLPKNLLNDRGVVTSPDVEKQLVGIGKAHVRRKGDDLTIVTWSSTMPICERAADALDNVGITTEIIDLRSVSPWDKDTIVASARKTGKLLVVHEDNHTCGMGGEICATVAEATSAVELARVTRADTYVPYEYSSHLEVLPSYKSVLARAADMLGLELEWEAPVTAEAGVAEIKALGAGPSDETVRINEILVANGDNVEADAVLVSVEADKAVMEISTPFAGIVDEVLVAEDQMVAVNTPIVRIRTDEETTARPVTEENPGRPILTRTYNPRFERAVTAGAVSNDVVLSSTYSVLGSRLVKNDEIVGKFSGWDSQEVLRRTGIESRYWIDENESALTLGVDACRKLLERENLQISDIDVLICSTGTPLQMTPSLSCQILGQLSPKNEQSFVQAYDVNAACSGYLYALQCAHDHLKSAPDLKILVVTSETLSPLLDDGDPSTYFLFADAATASLLSGDVREGNVNARVFRPVLSANGEAPEILSVPFAGTDQFVRMDGQAVFRVAVRRMAEMMRAACTAADLEIEDIDMIVPHQANERILLAVRKLLKIPEEKIFINIRGLGNTSSNTIPLGLEEIASDYKRGQKLGMVAFGGGFTYGSGILEIL
jgi:2-oxoisovalerate dehydrogenase E1 component